jgi:hypothetical protein
VLGEVLASFPAVEHQLHHSANGFVVEVTQQIRGLDQLAQVRERFGEGIGGSQIDEALGGLPQPEDELPKRGSRCFRSIMMFSLAWRGLEWT